METHISENIYNKQCIGPSMIAWNNTIQMTATYVQTSTFAPNPLH
uniref:Uncharacterized protein n=1 Tax=Rhizophora mucronata TaxID=61149 RepID=A0A2P2P432_RHIMU